MLICLFLIIEIHTISTGACFLKALKRRLEAAQLNSVKTVLTRFKKMSLFILLLFGSSDIAFAGPSGE